MPTMDIFNQDAFSMRSLTTAVDRLGYVPGLLASIPGLFVPRPVRTTDVWIEERDGAPLLILTSPRGAPVPRKHGTPRNARGFKTVRLALGDRVNASELQNMRAFGTETELQTVQAEVMQRYAGLKRDMELTKENLRLGCVQGLVLDADGSTLVDWATELGQTIPTEVDFDLDNASPASGVIRTACNTARRSIIRGLKGLGGETIQIVALCGDTFWDQLTAHPEVRQTYLNTSEAMQLRTGTAWSRFSYGDITFINYRSTDDGGATPTVGIPTTKAKFFPVGADIFQWAMSPGESFDFVNTMGRDEYAMIVPDSDRNMFVDVELYSYPLPVCTMPQALYRARNT